MALRSRSVLARGGDTAERNPSVGHPQKPFATAAACFVAGLILLLVLSSDLRFAFISSLTVTCIALSVVVLTGYVGQVSLAQMSLAGIGGFVLGHISSAWGIGFPWSLILAGSARFPLGLIIGLPALRLRGVNLAVVTLGFAAAMDAVVFTSRSFTGGTAGLPIRPPRLPGLNLAISPGQDLSDRGLRRARAGRRDPARPARRPAQAGPAGRMLLAIRSNERAAGSVGINVAQAKLMAFGLGEHGPDVRPVGFPARGDGRIGPRG